MTQIRDTGKQKKKPKSQKQLTDENMLTRLILGLILMAAGVMVFLSVNLSVAGEVFRGLRAASFGLCGALSPALFILPVWAGGMLLMTIQRKVSPRLFVSVCLLFVLLTTVADMLTYIGEPALALPDWLRQSLGAESYGRSLGGAYNFSSVYQGNGGGLLGMVLGWPLWWISGSVFTAILCIAGALVTVMVTFHVDVSRLRVWTEDRLQKRREKRSQAERRQEQEAAASRQERERQNVAAPAVDRHAAVLQEPPAGAQVFERPVQTAQPVQQPQPAQAAVQPEMGFVPQRLTVEPALRQTQRAVDYGFQPPAEDELLNYYPNPATPTAPAAGSLGGALRDRLNKILSGDAFARESELKARETGAAPSAPAPAENTSPEPPWEELPPIASLQEEIVEPVARPAAMEKAANPSWREQLNAAMAKASASSAAETASTASAPAEGTGESPSRRRRTGQTHSQQKVGRRTAYQTQPHNKVDADSLPRDVTLPPENAHPSNWQPELKLQPVKEGEKTFGERVEKPETVLAPYIFPSMELLNRPQEMANLNPAEDAERARRLEDTLASFKVDAAVRNITHGPAVTRFEMELAPGIQVNRVTKLQDNIAMNMASKSVRIEAPIPGKSLVGVEIANRIRTTVTLREVLESPEMRKLDNKPLAIALGLDIAGTPVTCDLAKMPHLLIAGQTGSGKSVCINTIISSLIYRRTPQDVRMILVDPKVVELQVYNGLPHLLMPVVSDPHKASAALEWAVLEMMNRYKLFENASVRHIDGYNEYARKAGEEPLPRIVIIIDELADLMMVCKKDVEERICRLAQLARACGIHLIVATQRPSVDVITGLIKANIPSRIAFKVAAMMDSRTILDKMGAEQLLGFGDMLYMPTGQFAPTRVQGCFLSDEEVNSVMDYIHATCPAQYDPNILEQLEMISGGDNPQPTSMDAAADAGRDPTGDSSLLMRAIEMAVQDGSVSTSLVQRRLSIGYARAGRLVDEMEKRGIVGQKDGAKPRLCLISREEYEQMKASGQLV